MIQTAMQLKAKIRNMANGDSTKAQILIRNYMMERFLERCATSKYKDYFVLKGGMFVASYVGLDTRATMDIDTTIQKLPLTVDFMKTVIQEMIDIPLNDGVTFQIIDVREIMEEHDYPGIRFMLDSYFDQLKQPIKIDISIGDIITPGAIEYSYPLMFEDRVITILTYNIETVLSEKMETILSRAEANTRMRDFYDIYVLLLEKGREIRAHILRDAFFATCNRRKSRELVVDAKNIILDIKTNENIKKQWDNYRSSNYYVGELEWEEVFFGTIQLAKILKIMG